MASMSLVFVVQFSICKRDFKIDQRFSIGLRSGEFPGQSKTFIAASFELSSLAWTYDMEEAVAGILSHL